MIVAALPVRYSRNGITGFAIGGILGEALVIVAMVTERTRHKVRRGPECKRQPAE